MLELWDRLPPAARGALTTLVTIALNGGVAALGSVVIDPDHFSLQHLKHLGIVFGVGALAGVVNWLRQSPWRKRDENIVDKFARSVPAILLACVLGASAAACGPKSYHSAVVADEGLSQALFALDDAENAAFKAQLIAPEKHKVYGAQILKLLKAGDDLTLALKAWDPSQPAPANIGAALNEVQGLLADLKIDSPKASQAIFAAETVLSVLRGTGVLPAANDVAEASEGWIIVEIKYWFGSELSFGPVFKNDVVHFDRLAVDVDNSAAGAVVLRHGQILLPAVARG